MRVVHSRRDRQAMNSRRPQFGNPPQYADSSQFGMSYPTDGPGQGSPSSFMAALDVRRNVRRHGLAGFWLNLAAPRRPIGPLSAAKEEWLRKGEVTAYM